MRLLRTLLALLLLLPMAAQAQPNFPKRDHEPVVDAAGLLNPAQKAEITKLAEDINTATTRQFVVATIPDLQGYDIADYGYQLGRAWGSGKRTPITASSSSSRPRSARSGSKSAMASSRS